MKSNTSRKLHRLVALIAAMALSVVSLTSCGAAPATSTPTATPSSSTAGAPAASDPAKPAESKVVVGLAHDPQNIGPFQGMSAGRIGILYTVYEFLVTTVGGEMNGVMMKDYEKLDDLTYNCEIYDYITDQAGNKITAADVAYSYNMGMTSGNLPKLGSIESVTVISDYVVQFKFKKLAIGDLGALWMECPIVSQKAYEASPDQMATKPVSTTAYQCIEFVSGSKMVFQNTGKYWQTDASKVNNCSKANVDLVEFDIITDAAQLTNALKTRAIDITCWLAAADIPDFKDTQGFAVSQIPDNTTYYLLFNSDAQQGKFANNPELRQALAYAIDSNQLLAGALGGSGNVVKTMGNTNYSDYSAGWTGESYYEQDLDKAKQMLVAAGGEGLSLNLMVTSGDINTKLATIIQAQLAQVGVTVKISTYDNQLYNDYKYKPEQWDIMLDQGGSTSYLVNVWKLAWDRNGYTHGGAENFVKDDKLQSLLESAMDINGHSAEAMDAFHQYLKAQCYGIGLVQSMTNIAHTDRITKVTTDARIQVTPGACDYSF